MTARLVAAFLLGGLLIGAPAGLYFNHHAEVAAGYAVECMDEMDELEKLCNERVGDEEMWVRRYFCSLRRAEELLQPHYPKWRGYFAERDRRQYDAEFGCADIEPHEWTEEELRSNAELGR